jgi:Family of unknown function (DUF6401)
VDHVTHSHPHTTAAARREAAQVTLTGLMTRLGETGLAAAAGLPGLLAEVDQHAAAVIEALCGDGRPLGPVALAGYAAGVRDAATERGWQVPAGERLAWSRADWPAVRLIAVCDIARAAGYA